MRPEVFSYFNKPLPRELQQDLLLVMYYRDESYGPMLFHDHNFTEIMIVQEGEVSIDFGDNQVHAGESCCIVIPPKMTHRTLIPSQTKVYSRMLLHLDLEKILPLIKDAYGLCFQDLSTLHEFSILPLNQHELHYLMNRLVRIRENQSINDLYAHRLVLSILFEFFAFFSRRQRATEGADLGLLSKQDPMLERILHLIEERFSEEGFNCSEIAKELFLSQGYLSRLFKDRMGTSLYRYIVDRRLERAHQLLLAGSPVMEAASQAGYSDYSSFLRAYKLRYERNPSENNPVIQGLLEA